MNFIEKLFNDFNERYLKEAKARGVDLGLQTVYTPIDKIENATNFRFADHITAETKSVGILFNTEFINYFIKELPLDYINNIKFTFFYDCKFDYNEVQDCIFFSQKNINIEMISIENIKDLDKVMAGKKFDIVFSNPPYNKNLDLKILKSLFEQQVADNIIFVHPAGYLFSHNSSSSLIYNSIKNSDIFSLKTAYLFWGNNLFGIACHTPLVISHWCVNNVNEISVFDTWNNEYYKVKNIQDISYLGKHFNEIKNSFSDLVKKYTNVEKHIQSPIEYVENNIKYKIYEKMGKVGVSLPKIVGIIDEKCTGNFFQSIYKNSDILVDTDVIFSRKINENSGKTGGISNAIVLWFNSETERVNFINYMKSKIYRIALSLCKTNPNSDSSCMSLIPWMDFTKEWNDKKLCEEFGISEELWQYIDNFIPDYYDDYKSGF